jgi:hypothetical protein
MWPLGPNFVFQKKPFHNSHLLGLDFKKIEAIEVVFRRFFKSLLEVWKKHLARLLCWQNLTNSPSNTLHGDKHCYIIIVWAWSLKTASWERHGKPSLLCLLRERNVGLGPWTNGYSRISPRRWQVFYLQFNRRWKRRFNLQWHVRSK